MFDASLSSYLCLGRACVSLKPAKESAGGEAPGGVAEPEGRQKDQFVRTSGRLSLFGDRSGASHNSKDKDPPPCSCDDGTRTAVEASKDDQKRPAPDTLYQLGPYLYETDSQGRVACASGKLVLEKGKRNAYYQKKVGRQRQLDRRWRPPDRCAVRRLWVPTQHAAPALGSEPRRRLDLEI